MGAGQAGHEPARQHLLRDGKRHPGTARQSRALDELLGDRRLDGDGVARQRIRLKFPTREIALWAIGGGILMGLGSRVGLGCNIGAFFATVTNGDLRLALRRRDDRRRLARRQVLQLVDRTQDGEGSPLGF
ncbi:MAG: YeeE/YedE family protein [Betaproteobacteria bacterium]|nr:YeeE/YedE family protein [Betaproteobacteria bacterium]